jgi:two-component system sporulation sensor kinase B
MRATQVFTYPIMLVTVCAMGLFLCDPWDTYEIVDVALSLSIAYVIAIYVSYIYHYMKDYGWIRGQCSRAEQYQATNQLARSMAHAVRNPLTITRGFVQLVSGKKLISKQVHTYCQHAESGIKEVDGVITDYLRCAEPEIETPHRLHVQAEIDKKIIPEIIPLCAHHSPFDRETNIY